MFPSLSASSVGYGFCFPSDWLGFFPPIYNKHKSVDSIGRDENFVGDFTKLEYGEFCNDHPRMPVSLLCQGTVKIPNSELGS